MAIQFKICMDTATLSYLFLFYVMLGFGTWVGFWLVKKVRRKVRKGQKFDLLKVIIVD